MKSLHQNTPLVKSDTLAKKLGIKNLYFKLDNLQPSSSFKIRGLGNCIKRAIETNPKLKTLVSSSGGNAGYAATLAAKQYHLEIHVFVPTTTSQITIDELKANGAIVVVKGSVWDETHVEAMKFLESLEKGSGFYVHPFEHPDTFLGHATLIDEIITEIGDVDVIVCSVGGGGLLSGILTGLLKAQKKTFVLAVETQGAASFHAAVNADRLVTLDEITSIAKSLGAKTVSEATLRLRNEYGRDLVRSVVVSDADAVSGVVHFANSHRFLVEPACGASLALAYFPHLLKEAVPELNPSMTVVIEVCGGFQVTLDMIEKWKQ